MSHEDVILIADAIQTLATCLSIAGVGISLPLWIRALKL